MADPVQTLGRSVTPEEAVGVLRAGGVVVLPLDTVYALAADATSARARAKLLAASGTPEHAVLAWHAGSASNVRAALDAAGARLSDRAWGVVDALLPGPVTLGIELPGGVTPRLVETLSAPDGLMTAGDRLMVRVPDHPVCRAILERLHEPIAMAAPPGETPTRSLADAALSIHAGGDPEAVEAYCDGAPQPVGQLSTHVDVDLDGAWRLVREGPVSDEEIRRRVGRLILFVCTGNTCRSPMAKALAEKLLAERGLPGIGRVEVASGGVAAGGGGAPATPEAVAAVAKRGGELGDHASATVDDELLRRADAIFVMTSSHLDALEQVSSRAAARARLLDPERRDIPDPIGGPPDMYDETAARIEALLERRLIDAGFIGGDGDEHAAGDEAERGENGDDSTDDHSGDGTTS